MKIYVIAGEASGDARGAELIRAMREQQPGWEFRGAGGREMVALLGPEAIHDWADEAVVGLWDVLKKYGYFKGQFDRMLEEIARYRPEALILIDYPGFNTRLAREARRRYPELRIIYYISPQVWAWNRGRIPKMAQYLDLMLCIFPFEKPLYESSGLRTEFVGHPMLDSLARKRIEAPRDPLLVGLFPGSREKEVRKIFPVMLAAAKVISGEKAEARFEASAASPALLRLMEAQRLEAGLDEHACPVVLRDSHGLMQRAQAGMVASGTATLESAYFGMPLVILYKVAWLTWEIGRRLVKVPFLGMPNLLAEREIAPEFLQGNAQPAPIAREVLRLLADPAYHRQRQSEMAEVIVKLGSAGAADCAARAVINHLEARPLS